MGWLQDKGDEVHGEEDAMAPDSGPFTSVVDPANIWCATAGATSGE
ncbi:MAG: hypothetical protein JW384_00672 [Nitrosomonadaceae bacterium]|nr:hypothetical protein [Nitrosomonadaceae bacterium]